MGGWKGERRKLISNPMPFWQQDELFHAKLNVEQVKRLKGKVYQMIKFSEVLFSIVGVGSRIMTFRASFNIFQLFCRFIATS